MTLRLKDGARYFLAYDAESRLTSVSGTVSASFAYNGDGQRVTATIGTAAITTYIGGYFEWQGGVGKSYYFAGGQRIAMRQGSTLYFLLTDHLGSTAITATSGGGWYAELRYYPWGGTRYSSGTTPTSFRYTGQRQAEVGLYYYGARYYDPQVGRFVSPDTIIPHRQGSQAWDRYAYVNNNPIKYTDPTGHFCDDVGINTICSADDDSNGWWVPPQYSIMVFGGSNLENINEPGPDVPIQMPVWITDQNGNLISTRAQIRYPGSKSAQANSAKGLSEQSDVVLICYSAGTESCLMYAKWRMEHNQGVEAVVLLGPTFKSVNENGANLSFTEPDGGGWSAYIDILLVNGADVYVLDDGPLYQSGNDASTYSPPTNSTGSFTYQRSYIPHHGDSNGFFTFFGTNDSGYIKSLIYYWLTYSRK
jgi:RHS repeat-associated protein